MITLVSTVVVAVVSLFIISIAAIYRPQKELWGYRSLNMISQAYANGQVTEEQYKNMREKIVRGV